MNIVVILLAVSLCTAALFTFGCAQNAPYRTRLASCDTSLQSGTACNDSVIETNSDYKLGFVEFDEQGWFWDRRQVNAIEQLIRTEAGDGQSNSVHGVIIVLFVHGWKNNASFDNENVEMFRSTLTQLSKSEKIQSGLDNRPARTVVGVYGGWRGLSAKWEPFKELSFWERKNTAHQVGHGALTELMADLEDLQAACNKKILANAPQTALVIVGHSFGGAAVYSAISQILTERFVDTIEHNHPLKPVGDVVILLNPAFEAARHYNLNELAVSISKYPESQRPVVAIFTSKGDWATHYLFPVGRFFSTLFENNRRDKPQHAANIDAVGWFTPFITHNLVYDTNATDSTSQQTTFNPKTQKHELHSLDRLQLSIQNVHVQRQKWHPNAPRPVVYTFDDCKLEPVTTFRPGDPFLIVSVDTRIMKDHSDITNPVLINFLREFILFCQSGPDQPSR